MSIREKLKASIFRLKIFIWYLFTEPMRQLKQVYIFLIKLLKALNKTLTWVYVGTIFMILSLFQGKKFVAGLFLMFLLVTLLIWEWQSGKFMFRYRQLRDKELKEEMKKNGPKSNK